MISLHVWTARFTRRLEHLLLARQLDRLSDRMLDDIGLEREDVRLGLIAFARPEEPPAPPRPHPVQWRVPTVRFHGCG